MGVCLSAIIDPHYWHRQRFPLLCNLHRVHTRIALIILCLLTIIRADSYGQNDGKDSNGAAAQIAEARIAEAVKTHWTNDTGFSLAPLKLQETVTEDDSDQIKQLEEKYPTAWKDVDEKFADAYAKRQEPLNNKLLKDAASLRNQINEAILAACQLRGGGSASAQLFKFSRAETEWILTQVQNGTAPEMSDQEFADQLRANVFYLDGKPADAKQEKEFSRCVTLFSKAEDSLTPTQRSVLRAQVVEYFGD